MAWPYITSRMKGPLIFFKKDWHEGRINSDIYYTYILPAFTNTKRIYEQVIGRQVILIEDSAPLYTARLTKAQHQERGNTLIYWPANSPDLNPIENVWRLLNYRIAKRFPKTSEEVRRYTEEEWVKLEIEDFKKYCTNMRERCWAVILANRSPTKW
jgi:transposase